MSEKEVRTLYSSLPPFEEMAELLEGLVKDAEHSYDADRYINEYTYKCIQDEYTPEQIEAIEKLIATYDLRIKEDVPGFFCDFSPAHFPYPKDWKKPQRATENSAGYDISLPCDIVVPSDRPIVVFTGVKWSPGSGCVNEAFVGLHIRSGLSKKIYLVNSVGVIDADYETNMDTHGDIGIILRAYDGDVELKRGERIAQAIIYPYQKTAVDVPRVNKRTGGFGSTGRE